ncbi:MAG: succinate dehydrogenase/fumarate reductase iron-sulfur subunit, partial [Gemmatimonadota bacterium]|nr:succinate dehydrogenase/fumarate reductase iron-sulfur subunit [Gemmatimonadota bacterium]
EGFGGCTWHGECQEACPKEISIDWIARLQRDFIFASASRSEEAATEVAI